jgi:hypothetical protein
MRDVNLFIATPCYDGNLSSGYVMALLALQRMLIRSRIGNDVCLHSDSLITRARNRISERFLLQPEYTHLLFIDADISFDPETVLRYLEFDKDIVAGIYPIKKLNLHELRRLPVDDDSVAEAATYEYSSAIDMNSADIQDGFAKVEYAASGFMLIRRQVLESMATHYPELKYQDDCTGDGISVCHGFFNTIIHEGCFLPEDYSFCKRWRDMGGEIWADVAGRFDHIGRYVYSGHVAAIALRSLKNSTP